MFRRSTRQKCETSLAKLSSMKFFEFFHPWVLFFFFFWNAVEVNRIDPISFNFRTLWNDGTERFRNFFLIQEEEVDMMFSRSKNTKDFLFSKDSPRPVGKRTFIRLYYTSTGYYLRRNNSFLLSLSSPFNSIRGLSLIG